MYYLAIDIGASSGRHILGSISDGKLELREVYRFENGMKEENGSLTWDVEALFREIKNGLSKCRELGCIPKSVAIDTWGVDYVLLDENKRELLPVFAYRDARTEKSMPEVMKIISQRELYAKTGIQQQSYNSIYQLYSDKMSGKLARAKYYLMMPEYLSYKLSGVMKNEYTIASTSNLINAETKDWDGEILDRLGFPRELFKKPCLPGTLLGSFTDEVVAEVGFSSDVVFCPAHDTASAVCACPMEDGGMYISSGTWSLIGSENTEPCLSEEAMEANFANEGGVEYRFRFLKNIMGMWLFQNIRKNIDKSLTYDEMMHLAEGSTFDKTVDPNAQELVAPENMIDAIKKLLGDESLPLGDVLKCVYLSLASSYAECVKTIEKISGKEISEIHIVGGGSRDMYLNRLTSKLCGKKVFIGLNEGTATGNLITQVMRDKGLTLKEGREIIKKTFKVSEVK